jgi:hypothetical protein
MRLSRRRRGWFNVPEKYAQVSIRDVNKVTSFAEFLSYKDVRFLTAELWKS